MKKTAKAYLPVGSDACEDLLRHAVRSVGTWEVTKADREKRYIRWKVGYRAAAGGTYYVRVEAKWIPRGDEGVDVTMTATLGGVQIDLFKARADALSALTTGIQRRLTALTVEDEPLSSGREAAVAARLSSVDRSDREWDYMDFFWRWPGTRPWGRVSGDDSYTEAGARVEFWMSQQNAIYSELRPFLDTGWEPVGEIGPSGIKLRTYRSIKRGAFGWIVMVLFYVGSCGLWMLFDLLSMELYAEPEEFRVELRRPRSSHR